MNNYKQYLFPAIIVVILTAVAVYLATRSGNINEPVQTINNYQDCIDAGNPSLESYPAQCKTGDGQTFTQEIGNELKNNDKIRSSTPRPNQQISSPLEISGEAVGNWFFEASFPAELIDANGKQLAIMPITAQGEWMTTDFVPYKGTMTFVVPQTPTGALILKRDNPSGLPEHDSELRIPVRFAQYNQSSSDKTTVQVFFNNSSQGAECEKTIAVTREVAKTAAVGRTALEELIRGVTPNEKSKGYSTLINPDTKINSLNIENGLAKVDFSSELENNSGGSCRAQAVRSQITQTLKQFPTVSTVILSVNGNESVLQP